MSDTEEPKEEKPKDVGAIWIMKTRRNSRYLSMTIEIDGKKRQFVAFKNHKKKKIHPDYRIYPSTPGKKSTYKEPKKIDDEPFPF